MTLQSWWEWSLWWGNSLVPACHNTYNKMTRMFNQQTAQELVTAVCAINIRWYFDKEAWWCGVIYRNVSKGWTAWDKSHSSQPCSHSRTHHPAEPGFALQHFLHWNLILPPLTCSSSHWERIWSFFYLWFSCSQIYFLSFLAFSTARGIVTTCCLLTVFCFLNCMECLLIIGDWHF